MQAYGFIKSALKSTHSLKGLMAEYSSRKYLSKFIDGAYYVAPDVPYCSQFASAELVEGIVTEKMSARDDPRWKSSGAETLDEYEMYSWQICGMACLKMILGALFPDGEHHLVPLAKDAEKHKVYRRNRKPDVRRNLDGMFHKPFTLFAGTFGLKSFSVSNAGPYYIAYLLKKSHFVIASVSPAIRDDSPEPRSRSGHLVLVTGFRMENKQISGFYIHNPSGFYNKSQEHHFIPDYNWEACFSGNIIVVYKK